MECALWWPSAVSGGMTDAPCPNEATTTVDDIPVCERCAAELLPVSGEWAKLNPGDPTDWENSDWQNSGQTDESTTD